LVKILFVLVGGAWATLAGGAEAAAEDARRYSFGVVPQQSASKLARSWSPLLQRLGERAGIEIRFRTAPDIPEFERRLAAGEYDFAYMNPYHYTVFSREPGYRAFAKASDKLIRGILVVRKDSPIRTPADLDESTIAFPAPAAFAASVLTRAYLNGESISFTPKYVSSHDSVYRTVAAGLYPAGGGVMRTLNSVEPEIRDQLRVLYTTAGYTPHAFAAHPRIPEPVVARLAQAMVAMTDDAQGRALLEPLNIKGFETAADPDWDDVRALDIGLLDDIATPAP
jgi:phosphonate transport system substrate-binding protein